MMLVPTTSDVALSVAVADKDITAEGLLVVDGMMGMGIVAESLVLGATEGVGATDDVGAILMVPFPEVGGVRLIVLEAPVEMVEDICSDAGTLRDWLCDGVGAGDTDDPSDPEGTAEFEGIIPELNDKVALGVTLASDGVMLGVSEGVGTTPEEDSTPVGRTPEVGSKPDEGKTPEEGRASDGTRLTSTLLGRTIGAEPVGKIDSTPERMLERMVGIAEGGTSEIADERMLGKSEMIEDTTGGRRPEIEAGGVSVGAGAVGPRPVEGTMPGSSETSDDRTEGRSSKPELAGTLSDVGIAPELRIGAVGDGIGEAESPVPNAVVIPMTTPEVGNDKIGWESEDAAPLVGRTTGTGTLPVPITAVGVGSRGTRSDESRPPSKPDDVGCKIVGGRLPVGPATPDETVTSDEPGTMKGPRKLDASGDEGWTDGTGAGVGSTMLSLSGSPPVEATRCPD